MTCFTLSIALFNYRIFLVLQKLSLVNGVLFTGGWAKSGLYFDVVGAVFKVNDNFFHL